FAEFVRARQMVSVWEAEGCHPRASGNVRIASHPRQSPAMTFIAQLQARSHPRLCVGLDPEPARLPGAWAGDASKIFDFCRSIVDATHDLVCAFKPQIAYFAAHRAEEQLERLISHIHAVAPGVPVILDAKRGDSG